MNDSEASPRRYWPLGQLILARLREFYREPEIIFWVYGFPILIVVALGIAFRNKPVERIAVDVQQDPEVESAAGAEGIKGAEFVLQALFFYWFLTVTRLTLQVNWLVAILLLIVNWVPSLFLLIVVDRFLGVMPLPA